MIAMGNFTNILLHTHVVYFGQYIFISQYDSQGILIQ